MTGDYVHLETLKFNSKLSKVLCQKRIEAF